jgi:predicted enzyme related to lactoylglutathione lyase
MDLSRIIVFTPNVERLARFYENCFGLSEAEGGSQEWAELDAGGCSIAFHQYQDDSAVRDGWVKIVFGSKDVVGEKLRLEGLGVEMSDIVEFDGIQLCEGRDPDGNWFQISSRGR